MGISLKDALRIAVEVHGDQKDKAGDPYLFHVMRVAMAMDTDEERVVAILHDTIEDARDRVVAIGHTIYDAYGAKIGDAVVALTRQVTDAAISVSATEADGYLNYIRRLSTNPLAVKVKLADLEDNLDPSRLSGLPESEQERLWKKYREAQKFLLNLFTQEKCKHPDRLIKLNIVEGVLNRRCTGCGELLSRMIAEQQL